MSAAESSFRRMHTNYDDVLLDAFPDSDDEDHQVERALFSTCLQCRTLNAENIPIIINLARDFEYAIPHSRGNLTPIFYRSILGNQRLLELLETDAAQFRNFITQTITFFVEVIRTLGYDECLEPIVQASFSLYGNAEFTQGAMRVLTSGKAYIESEKEKDGYGKGNYFLAKRNASSALEFYANYALKKDGMRGSKLALVADDVAQVACGKISTEASNRYSTLLIHAGADPELARFVLGLEDAPVDAEYGVLANRILQLRDVMIELAKQFDHNMHQTISDASLQIMRCACAAEKVLIVDKSGDISQLERASAKHERRLDEVRAYHEKVKSALARAKAGSCNFWFEKVLG